MKINKILSVSVLLSGLFLSSCSEADYVDENNKPSDHIHEYEKLSDSAYHWEQCKSCGQIKEGTKVAHAFTDNAAKAEQNKTATCTEKGYVWQVCECGKEKQRLVEKVAHNFNIVASTTATCEEAGENTMKCSVCGKIGNVEPQEALNHVWVDSEDKSGNVNPTCTEVGIKKVKCSREGCTVTKMLELNKLNHNYKEVSATTPSEEGYATVHKEVCENCTDYRYRIDAKDVNTATKTPQYLDEPNYILNDDGSVRFYGRPYHNSMELRYDAAALPPAEVFDVADYYNKDIVGSFLEYEFEVGADGIKGDLVCEILPNEYLRGKLFFVDPEEDVWAPAIMNDDLELSKTRFIVEIDGVMVEQDSLLDTTNLPGNDYYVCEGTGNKKDLFKFPLVNQLNFNEGVHTIRFLMGSNYICSLYNIYIQ